MCHSYSEPNANEDPDRNRYGKFDGYTGYRNGYVNAIPKSDRDNFGDDYPAAYFDFDVGSDPNQHNGSRNPNINNGPTDQYANQHCNSNQYSHTNANPNGNGRTGLSGWESNNLRHWPGWWISGDTAGCQHGNIQYAHGCAWV